MWRMPKRLAVTAVVMTLGMVGAVLAPAGPALADGPTTCYIVCDGVHPSSAGYEDANGVFRPCNDARTVYAIYDDFGGVNGAYVELRYSSKCRMAWARGFHDVKIEGFWANGTSRDKVYQATGFPGSAITLALNDANLLARACVYKDFLYRWECTAKY